MISRLTVFTILFTATFAPTLPLQIISFAHAQDSASAVAQAGATVGQCFVLRGREKIRIAKGLKLFAGDQIMTSQNSVVEIIYADGSNNLIQENSSISIEEFKTTINGERIGVKSVLNMVRGKARFFFRPRPGGVDATVKTKSSVMGIRGTTFVVDEDENSKETRVAVLTGQVAVKSADAADAAPVLVKPNQVTSVKLNQKPAAPRNLSVAEVEQINQSVTPPAGKSQDGFIPETLELPAPEPEEMISTPEAAKNEGSKSKDAGITAVFIDRRTNRDPLCARYRFDELKRLAQSFDPDAVGMGRQLAKCAANSDEAVYWLAFYHMGQAELNQAAAVGRYLQAPSKTTQLDTMVEYDRAIYEASNGSPQALKEKVDAKNSAFARDGEALLVLSRSLVRAGQLEAARSYYDRYIKLKMLKADDSDVRVESIYTYLWSNDKANDFQTAEKKFSDILRENISPTARASAQRGYLIATSREYQTGTMRERIELSIRNLDMPTVGYRERSATIRAQIFNHYNVKARYFTLDASENEDHDEKTTSQSAEVFVARRFENVWGLGVDVGAGFSGVGKGHALYMASMDGDYDKYSLSWKLGILGAPLTFSDRPVRSDGFDIRDNTVSLEASYSFYASYRFALHMLSNDGGFIEHQLAVRVPLLPRVPATDKLNLKLFAQSESHAKGMVRYYSPKSLTIFGAGVEFDSQVVSWLRLAAEGDFGIMSQKLPTELDESEPNPTETPFAKLYDDESGNRLRAAAKATYIGFAQWHPWLSLNFMMLNGSEGDSLFRHHEAQLGVAYEF